ncbi:MAG: helix-turn-helix transcriptional regulator [Oscillospiraceae bacterium]|jgi:transcriptional regulator with XRE-family HTH domain|nr:helix-turn-helix transcriptional regulator [Oscillospiraceae bacterium]
MSNALAASLVHLRKKRKLSQREAAAQLGISQSLLSHYERGIREGSLDFLLRAAQFYAVSCDILLGRSTEEAAATSFLQTDSPLKMDGTFCLSTVARAVAALSCSTENADEAPRLVRALAVLLLRVSGGEKIPAHWLNAVIEELLDSEPKKKSNAVCVHTVRKAAVGIVKDVLAGADGALSDSAI